MKCSLVLFHGRKFGDEKETFWRNADIFVFPTYYPNECFPLVLLEAMQHGVPCVSTNEGGISGIIEDGDNGLLVSRQDCVALALAIETLLNNQELCQGMGLRGREVYLQELTLSVFEQRFATILDKFVS